MNDTLKKSTTDIVSLTKYVMNEREETTINMAKEINNNLWIILKNGVIQVEVMEKKSQPSKPLTFPAKQHKQALRFLWTW